MDTLGSHLLAEYWGCDKNILDDQAHIEALMRAAATAAGAHIVEVIFHRFSPQGVSGVVVVEESHISIHTWPERGYAAVDFYTCGADNTPKEGYVVLQGGLRASRSELMVLRRGHHNGLKVVSHSTESSTSDEPHKALTECDEESA